MEDENYYDVTFVSDVYTITTTVSVPNRHDDDPAYGDDDSAIDIARRAIMDSSGFDPEAYSFEVLVQPAF